MAVLSGVAVLYGILWFVSLVLFNAIFLIFVSGLGVLLLIIAVIAVDNPDEENLNAHVRLSMSIDRLKEELRQEIDKLRKTKQDIPEI